MAQGFGLVQTKASSKQTIKSDNMLGIIYCTSDEASNNMGKRMLGHGFEETIKSADYTLYADKQLSICETRGRLTDAEVTDSLGFEAAIFLSKHQSVAGRASFTTHPMGNWNDRADLGGRPKKLSVSAPLLMLNILNSLCSINAESIERTYEATHHGPLLDTPSLFVELGGNAAMTSNKDLACRIADSVYASLQNTDVYYEKVAIGIGCRHYPSKFTALAKTKGYAFSHMLPSHMIYNKDGTSNLDMLGMAAERSTPKAESAVIEWKGLSSSEREEAIRKLNEIGIDYERV